MNTIQRLLSNTALAFLSNVILKASSSLLFIMVGRSLGPSESGTFSLGITYFTFVFGISALGLHELMVREVAPRRDESGRYFVNFATLRLLLSAGTYALLILGLRLLLPYSAETNQIILILALAAIPEAIFSICQSLFEAHEQLTVPTLAAIVNSGLKLVGGTMILAQGGGVLQVAWVLPIGSALSLLVFVPGLLRLLRRVPQRVATRLDIPFSVTHLRSTPGFFVIHLFSLIDYQTDAFLISIMLGETALGFYAAAQTILLGFNLMPVAVRAAIYPLMARYNREAPNKLAILYEKASHYLVALVLPIAAGVSLLAGPIINLVFGPAFAPAIPVLQISIWAIVFLFLNVPNARLMLINNRQRQASGLMGVSMLVNVGLNLWLIPRYGINGAAVSRVLASLALFLGFYAYTSTNLMRYNILPLVIRPLIATVIMTIVVWPLRDLLLIIPVVAGVMVYGIAALLLGVFPSQDIAYWQQIFKRRTG